MGLSASFCKKTFISLQVCITIMHQLTLILSAAKYWYSLFLCIHCTHLGCEVHVFYTCNVLRHSLVTNYPMPYCVDYLVLLVDLFFSGATCSTLVIPNLLVVAYRQILSFPAPERGGLVVNASDPEVGGSSPTRVKPCCVLEQDTFTPQKVLVIPRKRWLRPNMTEKLFTGTLRINQPTIPAPDGKHV